MNPFFVIPGADTDGEAINTLINQLHSRGANRIKKEILKESGWLLYLFFVLLPYFFKNSKFSSILSRCELIYATFMAIGAF